MKNDYYFHGSDIERIKEKYKIKNEEIINFAANVNPLGISPQLKAELSNHMDIITTYPDRNYTTLKKSIAGYVGTNTDNILVGNGTSELISLFIEIINPKKAMIIGPTYSEYERKVTLMGGNAYYFPLHEDEDFKLEADCLIDKLDRSIDMLIMCNPNNPTSSCVDLVTTRKILDACKENHIYVLIDETYIEFVTSIEAYSAVSLSEYYNNVIILRSTSKFFASPGLRLGYAIIGNTDLISKINQNKNPWMINSIAAKAGEIMFADRKYIKDTSDLINKERDFMYNAFLATDGFKPYKPYANFMLVKINKPNITSKDIFEGAITNRLLIRDCSTFPFLNNNYFRFCFMEHEDNLKLLDCIRSI